MRTGVDTTISEIKMSTASSTDQGLGTAYEVEQCMCPMGYSGISCEVIMLIIIIMFILFFKSCFIDLSLGTFKSLYCA